MLCLGDFDVYLCVWLDICRIERPFMGCHTIPMKKLKSQHFLFLERSKAIKFKLFSTTFGLGILYSCNINGVGLFKNLLSYFNCRHSRAGWGFSRAFFFPIIRS